MTTSKPLKQYDSNLVQQLLVMQTIFGTYDHLIIIYSMYVFDDKWPFCLVAMATLNFKKGIFLNDNSFRTTEAVQLLFGSNVAWVRAIQNS